MIISILGFAALGHLGADLFSQFDRLPMKPLKCNMCLTYWIAVIPLTIQYGFDGPLVAAIAAITSETIYRILNRI